jgi:Fe2+ transport system protein B
MSILSEHYADLIEDVEPLEEATQPEEPGDLMVTVVDAVPFERNILFLYEIFKAEQI